MAKALTINELSIYSNPPNHHYPSRYAHTIFRIASGYCSMFMVDDDIKKYSDISLVQEAAKRLQ